MCYCLYMETETYQKLLDLKQEVIEYINNALGSKENLTITHDYQEFKQLVASPAKSCPLFCWYIYPNNTKEVIKMKIESDIKRLKTLPSNDKYFYWEVHVVQRMEPGLAKNQIDTVEFMYSWGYKVKMVNCESCEQSFEKTREWAKFCSDKCRQAAHRAKSK